MFFKHALGIFINSKFKHFRKNNQNKISNRSSFSTDRSVAKELPLFACIFVTFPQRYDYLRGQ